MTLFSSEKNQPEQIEDMIILGVQQNCYDKKLIFLTKKHQC